VWLRTGMEIGATYGWRKSEVTSLSVKQIDMFAKVIRLEPDTTKNDDGREVTLTANLVVLLRACMGGKQPNDFVLTWEDGSPVRDFRQTWRKVCRKAGVPNLLFHDLRRTAARALRNAGVAEEVIMKIGGWRTSSVFKRYSIVAQSDIRDAVQKLEKRRDDFSQSLAKETDKSTEKCAQNDVVN
jgi:integrase